MIDIGHSQWVAPVGTCPSWLFKSLLDLGLTDQKLRTLEQRHAVCSTMEGARDVMQFGVIRHPASWLEEIYFYLQSNGHHAGELDDFAKLDQTDLNAFALDYTMRMPGAIDRFFDQFDVHTFARCEDMPHALFMALDTMGVSIRGPIGKPSPWRSQMDTRLRRLVVDAEDLYCERYEYF